MKTKYHGVEIMPVDSQDELAKGMKWYVPSSHKTGVPFSSQYCAHYATLTEAKQAILQSLADMPVWDPDTQGKYEAQPEQMAAVRKAAKMKYGHGARMQFSDHGAGRHSVQIFSRGELIADINL